MLARHVADFLPTVRVGIDFGEHAGGIAVAKGTTILHAETYLDFHEATLEQRRQLRRGRRTRHAKKMRLARLRSWILRQEISSTISGAEVRNGKARLPDPYKVLKDRQFWVQPGVYQQPGKDPQQAENWIHLAKRGKVDAIGFVRALTLIFKKRGYKWDDRALSEMTDTQLKDFLEKARVPQEVPQLRENVEREIQQREENPGTPIRGRKKVAPSELRKLLDEACARQRQPRVAEHRMVKEADLAAVIEGFGKHISLPLATIDRWKKELIGLLNKTLREPRFDNRVRSGCTWCGKKTPRKSRPEVRELAYYAAVNNLRARSGWRERFLTEEEKVEFLNWWENKAKAPGLETIKRRISRLNPEQKGMANQFYDLLKSEKPRGRASLCIPHLKMAAEGKTMKDAGVEWQTLAIRNAPNPSRQQHDARVLHRLEQILFLKDKQGEEAWRYGPVSFISLEVPEPQTERLRRGQSPERKSDSFKDRLLKETDGQCVYCTRTATHKDHIFPRSRGGPDLWDNQVAACETCNDTKGDRTPFEWLSSDRKRWEDFKQRVASLPSSARKKQILLNEDNDYPGGDPTPFARVGSRPRQFVALLRKLFQSYGIRPPELAYRTEQSHVQLIRGLLTTKLRASWRQGPDGSANFPPKNPWDLYNHAQDAALVAACPPHTWRDRIFINSRERPGLAVSEIAPNWAGFIRSRMGPLIHILGHYPISWKRSLFKETLWQKPDDIEAEKGIVYRPLKDITVAEILKTGKKEGIVSDLYRDKLQGVVKRLGLDKLDPQKQKSQTVREEELNKELPGVRRLKMFRQKVSGVWVRIQPKDGPARKMIVDSRTASEGAVFWLLKKGKGETLGISIIRPQALRRFKISSLDPQIPQNAMRIGKWRRNQIIWLKADAEKAHPEGWYRLKEFSDSGVILLPENAMPEEIRRRKDLPRLPESACTLKERRLGKKEILNYWLQPRKDN